MPDGPTGARLSRLNRAAHARADELEARLARLLEPILADAGRQAASRFRRTVTDHLTASLRAADRDALREVGVRHGLDAARAAARPFLTAAVDVQSTSTMVCVKPRPEEAAALADPDGYPAENLHCTLVFLGELDGPLDEVAAALAAVAAAHAPLAGIVGGYGQFGTPDGGAVGILLPDVPGLVELRVAVTDRLAAAGIGYAREHGFEAHVTVDPDPEPGEWEAYASYGQSLHFDALLLVRGDQVEAEVPLTGRPPITAAGDPMWTPPAGDELVDVPALVARIRAATDPVRNAFLQAVVGQQMRLTDPLEREFKFDIVPGDEASDLDGVILEWAEEAQDVAGAALLEAEQGAGDIYLVTDRATGTVAALANVEKGADSLIVHNIGSAGGGAGTTLLQMIAQRAAAEEQGVRLVATPDAVSYYNRLPGWKQGEGREFHLPADKASAFARGVNASPAGLSFDVKNPFVAKLLAQAGSQVTGIADTTRLNVMRIMSESYDAGLSIPHTADAIREGMAASAGSRATLIARTELAGAANGGSLAAVQIVASETGQSYTKRWLTAEGAHFPRHELYEGLDGQTVGLDEYFDVGGVQMQFPGDPDGPPEESCNCRCAVAYSDGSEGESGDG